MNWTAAIFAVTAAFGVVAAAAAAEPSSEGVAAPVAGPAFFKPDDVVAMLGGEEMAVRRDDTGLELSILGQPGLEAVVFRNLAQEGDTVFEQFRDLNFPSWEEQIGRVGATVVVAQFGRMESFAGEAGVPGFIEAYERLLERVAAGGRRVVLLPTQAPAERAAVYNRAVGVLARRRGWRYVEVGEGSLEAAWQRAFGLRPSAMASSEPVRALVRRKNQLWFHYWRPQNWAFLHGDRTEQPSSRDHLDQSKRWFPEEMERWLPLVAAAEKEIRETLKNDLHP